MGNTRPFLIDFPSGHGMGGVRQADDACPAPNCTFHPRAVGKEWCFVLPCELDAMLRFAVARASPQLSYVAFPCVSHCVNVSVVLRRSPQASLPSLQFPLPSSCETPHPVICVFIYCHGLWRMD